jgi:hypothetical protein
LISFTAKNQHDYGYLTWVTGNETASVQYDVEKSTDAIHFTKITTVPGNGYGSTYNFTDPEIMKGSTYYRIKLYENGGKYSYSKVASLNTAAIQFEIKSLVNPFDNNLSFNLLTPSDRQASITVSDGYGKVIKHMEIRIYKGLNPVSINDLNILSNGTYLLRIASEGQAINKQVIKLKK